jgi:putative transcriptional regulator
MKNTLLGVASEIAADLYKGGAIDTQTMREFDIKCLPPVKVYSPTQIKRIPLRNKVSQAVLAAFLNTSPCTIRQWEQGLKRANGISLKVFSLVDHHGLAYIAV